MSEGRKFDETKLRLDLLPINPLYKIAEVLGKGAEKYGDRNWEEGIKYSRLYAALLIHLTAWWNGQDIDPESGLNHLGHVACNILFLLEFLHTHPEFDDRPTKKIEIPETVDNKIDPSTLFNMLTPLLNNLTIRK